MKLVNLLDLNQEAEVLYILGDQEGRRSSRLWHDDDLVLLLKAEEGAEGLLGILHESLPLLLYRVFRLLLRDLLRVCVGHLSGATRHGVRVLQV